MLLITSEFSLSMIHAPDGATIVVRPLRPSEVKPEIEAAEGNFRIASPVSYKTEKLHVALGIPCQPQSIRIGDRVLVIENAGWQTQRAFVIEIISDADGCVPTNEDPFEE